MARKRIDQLDKNLKMPALEGADTLRWSSVRRRGFSVRGLPWFEENGGRFCRLPLRAETRVREPVWALAQAPAGGCVAFRSDSTAMAVRVRNAAATVMPHMPGTGSNGLILYAGEAHRLRPWATVTPDQEACEFERPIFRALPGKVREFRLYMPLYMALEDLRIGLDRDARILKPTPPEVKKPIVFYGTSITQGGCASTAGSDYVSRVGRLLNAETVNLGFSGNGKGEPELARLIAEIDASVFVLDYVANVTDVQLRRTLPVFMRILRKRHPATPLLLVTNLCYSRYAYESGTQTALEAKRDTMIAAYVKARRGGDRNVHLVDGFGLIPFGTDSAYVDGAHPTSHGFHQIADRIAPFIEQVLCTAG